MTLETAPDPALVIPAPSAAQADPPAASVPADAATEPAAGSEVQPATGEIAAPPAASDPPRADEPPRKSADQRIKELIAERNALRAMVAQAPPAKPAAPEPPKPAEPEKPPAIEDFDDVNKWAAEFTAYTQRAAAGIVDSTVRKALGKADSERAAQSTQQQFAEREAAYAKDNPGYADRVADPELQRFVTQAISQAIVESDIGPALGDYLASNLGDLERISRLQPHQQARELGKIEAKIAATPKRQTTPPAKVVQQTKAPAPPTPVGNSTPSKSLADMPLDEYLANRTWARLN